MSGEGEPSSKQSPRNTLLFCAQAKAHELRMNRLRAGIYHSLPNYDTPKKVEKPVNPFNDKDPQKLMGPTISPDLFKCVMSPSQLNKQSEFFWTFEDVSRINPADIVPTQQDLEESFDEVKEQSIQEAIRTYFDESHNIYSPEECVIEMETVSNRENLNDDVDASPMNGLWENAAGSPCLTSSTGSNCKHNPLRVMSSTPSMPKKVLSRTCSRTSRSSQTGLSFPVDLPQNVLDVLLPYFTTLDEEDSRSQFNTSSVLRRKLFLHDSLSVSDNEIEENKRKIACRTLLSPEHELNVPPSPVISPIDGFNQRCVQMAGGCNKREDCLADLNFTQEMETSSVGMGDCRMTLDCEDVPSTGPSDTGYFTTSFSSSHQFKTSDLTPFAE